jgi:hypothetical protein
MPLTMSRGASHPRGRSRSMALRCPSLIPRAGSHTRTRSFRCSSDSGIVGVGAYRKDECHRDLAGGVNSGCRLKGFGHLRVPFSFWRGSRRARPNIPRPRRPVGKPSRSVPPAGGSETSGRAGSATARGRQPFVGDVQHHAEAGAASRIRRQPARVIERFPPASRTRSGPCGAL